MNRPSTQYLKILESIHSKAISCGRNPNEITLVAVTKKHSLDEVEDLYDQGCRQFGESRLQEALPKIEAGPPNISWHYIGPLQKNKVLRDVQNFSWIHSIDTPDLAWKVSNCAAAEHKKIKCLLQVNTSGESTKQGLSPKAWESLFVEIKNLPFLEWEGVMTMAPLTDDESVIRHSFRELREFRDHLAQLYNHPFFHLSMGMSNDYLIAIEEKSTILRIGTALFS